MEAFDYFAVDLLVFVLLYEMLLLLYLLLFLQAHDIFIGILNLSHKIVRFFADGYEILLEVLILII